MRQTGAEVVPLPVVGQIIACAAALVGQFDVQQIVSRALSTANSLVLVSLIDEDLVIEDYDCSWHCCALQR